MAIEVMYKLAVHDHWHPLENYDTFEQAWEAAHAIIDEECINKETETIELRFRKVE